MCHCLFAIQYTKNAYRSFLNETMFAILELCSMHTIYFALLSAQVCSVYKHGYYMVMVKNKCITKSRIISHCAFNFPFLHKICELISLVVVLAVDADFKTSVQTRKAS